MHFEDRVRLRLESLGGAYKKRRMTLPLLVDSWLSVETMRRVAPTAIVAKDNFLSLAASSVIFGVMGDEYTLYSPKTRTTEEFFVELPDLPVKLPFLQIGIYMSELQYGMYIPTLAEVACWHNSQAIYLICEYLYKEPPHGNAYALDRDDTYYTYDTPRTS